MEVVEVAEEGVAVEVSDHLTSISKFPTSQLEGLSWMSTTSEPK